MLCAEAVLALGAVGAAGARVANLVEVVLLPVSGPGVVAGDQLIPHLAGGLLVVGVAASHLLCLPPDELREVPCGVVRAVLGRLGLVQLDFLVPETERERGIEISGVQCACG